MLIVLRKNQNLKFLLQKSKCYSRNLIGYSIEEKETFFFLMEILKNKYERPIEAVLKQKH